MINFCQVRRTLGCIFKIISLSKDLSNLIWPKVAYHGMAYFIFLKFLRCLVEFRENPHVQIPPKSFYIISQSLGKLEKTIENLKIKFLFGSLLESGLVRRAGCSPSIGCRLAQHAHAPLASSAECVFVSSLRLSAMSHSLFPINGMWAPHVSPLFPLPHHPSRLHHCCFPPLLTVPAAKRRA
jgi:hypothetical protein